MASPAWAQFKRAQPAAAKPPADPVLTKPQADSPAPAVKPTADPANPKPAEATLSAIKLPPGAVVILCEQAQQALSMIPKAIVLAPAEYEKLINQIEQLKRQLTPNKPQPPSVCRLTGHVAEGVASIRASFEFKTSVPGKAVNLGCQRAWPTAASLDGRPAWIQSSEDGYIIQVEAAGAHRAELDVLVPLAVRKPGVEHGLDLELPGAAISMLDRIDLPAGIREVILNTQSVRPQPVDPRHIRIEGQPISPNTRLEMTWKGQPSEPAGGPPVLAATQKLVVRVDAATVVTQSEVNLQVLRGQTNQWNLTLPVPSQAALEVRAFPQDEARVQSITRSTDKTNPTLTVQLKESGSEPVRLLIELRQPRRSGAFLVTPVRVLGALSQKGQIEVNAPDRIRLRYEPGLGVSQRGLTEENRREGVRAIFEFWNIPIPNEAGPFGLLTLQADDVKGAVEVKTSHSLQMSKESAENHFFKARTKIDVTPVRAAVDHLVVTIPPGYRYDKNEGPAPLDQIEEVVVAPSGLTATVRLAQKLNRPFSLTLPGTYDIPNGQTTLSLELPKPVSWSSERVQANQDSAAAKAADEPVVDRGVQVRVTLQEGLELTGRQFRMMTDPELSGALRTLFPPLRPQSAMREYIWQSDAPSGPIKLAWQQYRPDLSVDGVADVTLYEKSARVRQRLKFQTTGPTLPQARLSLPALLQDKVRVVSGGTLQSSAEDKGADPTVLFSRPAAREQEIELEYGFPLPQWVESPLPTNGELAREAGGGESTSPTALRRFAVPLAQSPQATRGINKVRIWCDQSQKPANAAGQWEELPTEIVADRESLPALVLESGLDRPLALSLTRMPIRSTTGALVDRILVKVDVGPSGIQSYRTKYLLDRIDGRRLEIELPVLLTRSRLEIRLAGTLHGFQLIDESGREATAGKRARVQIEPGLYRGPTLLEINYDIDTTQVSGNGLIQSTFSPPVLADSIVLGRLRWEIHLRPGWMAIRAGTAASADLRWGWAGWLVEPQAALTSRDLSQWIQSPDRAGAGTSTRPAFVGWQTNFEPLVIFQVPERIWLMGWSLVFLGAGLFLLFAPLSRFLFWLLTAVVTLALAAVEILWPATLPAILFGCEPGIVVLLLVIVIYWALHQRYRRRVVLMPGFARSRSGSAIVRTNGIRAGEGKSGTESAIRRSALSSEVRG